MKITTQKLKVTPLFFNENFENNESKMFFPKKQGGGWKIPFFFLNLPLLKMKKTEATFQKGIDVAQLFCFNHFFHFGKEVLQNGQNVSKNGQNSTILTPGGQNIQFMNKIHKIKKFPTSSKTSLIHFFLCSQEALPNGRNVSKSGQNSTFLTPGG